MTLIRALNELLGERATTNRSIRDQHGRDESYHRGAPPDVVVFPNSNEEVARIVDICREHRTPIIPYGAGTSLEGQIAAVRGGVSIDLSHMNRVVQVNPADLDATVQAGITRQKLNEHVRDLGLFFPVDPGAEATLGGMASTRASGTNAVRYGTMRDNVLSLLVVLADGSTIRTGGRPRKSAAGYDLTALFIGAEGTLGVITELTVRLYGRPEAMSAAVCSFRDLPGAVETVIETIQIGVSVARIELLDEAQMDAVNRFSGLDNPVRPTLFLEFHGSVASVRDQTETVASIAREHGGDDFRWAVKQEDRNRLWRARHNAAYACKALRPGCDIWPTDVCVPISRLAECILETRRDLEHTGLLGPIVGHVGDGNFHVVLVVDPNDTVEMDKAARFNERLIGRALAMEGTCTGEHGIGLGKREHLQAERGEAVRVMAGLKRCLDPLDLMNPGKLFLNDSVAPV